MNKIFSSTVGSGILFLLFFFSVRYVCCFHLSSFFFFSFMTLLTYLLYSDLKTMFLFFIFSGYFVFYAHAISREHGYYESDLKEWNILFVFYVVLSMCMGFFVSYTFKIYVTSDKLICMYVIEMKNMRRLWKKRFNGLYEREELFDRSNFKANFSYLCGCVNDYFISSDITFHQNIILMKE